MLESKAAEALRRDSALPAPRNGVWASAPDIGMKALFVSLADVVQYPDGKVNICAVRMLAGKDIAESSLKDEVRVIRDAGGRADHAQRDERAGRVVRSRIARTKQVDAAARPAKTQRSVVIPGLVLIRGAEGSSNVGVEAAAAKSAICRSGATLETKALGDPVSHGDLKRAAHAAAGVILHLGVEAEIDAVTHAAAQAYQPVRGALVCARGQLAVSAHRDAQLRLPP